MENVCPSISDYFDEVLNLLKEYQWIYNYSNTDVLVQNVFEEIPTAWLAYFKGLRFNDLKDLVCGKAKDDCPKSLKDFLVRIKELSIYQVLIEPKKTDYNLSINCGLSIKKHHEIASLAPIVADICEATSSKEVIDVGAGLGYMSYLLAEEHNCFVVAIEGCAEKIKLALKTQLSHHQSSQQNITFLHHFITKDSQDEIEAAINKQFNDSEKICICGLHACADLSITILELFLRMKQVKSLVIMPCCYHRLILENKTGGREYFSSFPVSFMLKSKFAEHDAGQFLRRPFLRLACQQSLATFVNMNDKEHQEHAETFLRRAVLQKAAEGFDCSVSRLKRKTGKSKCGSNDFASYLENLHRHHKLVHETSTNNGVKIEDTEFKQKMCEIWGENNQNLFLMEVLTALQASIQSICENILLQDRAQFLKENGVNCYIRKITDDNISPRCHALIAIKE